MAYISTTDERYGGTYLSSSAGARDAPYSLAAGYVLAQGIAAAGYGATIPASFLADKDAYSLGILAPGRYTVTVSGFNWDYSNSIYGISTPSLEILNSIGSLLYSSYFGTYSFSVYESSTYYAAAIGTSYSSTEYKIYYTYDGALPSVTNYAATGTGAISGSLQVGSTISISGTFADSNGIVGVVGSLQWFEPAPV